MNQKIKDAWLDYMFDLGDVSIKTTVNINGYYCTEPTAILIKILEKDFGLEVLFGKSDIKPNPTFQAIRDLTEHPKIEIDIYCTYLTRMQNLKKGRKLERNYIHKHIPIAQYLKEHRPTFKELAIKLRLEL